MLRVSMLSCCLSLAFVIGCDGSESDRVTFEVGPDDAYPIPGLGLGNRVEVSVRHVGFEPMLTPDDRADEPTIGDLRVVDADNTLADDRLMFEGETLRFNYDDTTFELTLDSFYLPSQNPGDPGVRATLVVERL